MTKKESKKPENYGPCPRCGGMSAWAYTNWVLEYSNVKQTSSYIECDDCKLRSKFTCNSIAWDKVVVDWKNKGLKT